MLGLPFFGRALCLFQLQAGETAIYPIVYAFNNLFSRYLLVYTMSGMPFVFTALLLRLLESCAKYCLAHESVVA